MQTIIIKGTRGPIYLAILRLIAIHISSHGLPDMLTITMPSGNRIVVTSDWRLTTYIAEALSAKNWKNFDWQNNTPSSCDSEVL